MLRQILREYAQDKTQTPELLQRTLELYLRADMPSVVNRLRIKKLASEYLVGKDYQRVIDAVNNFR